MIPPKAKLTGLTTFVFLFLFIHSAFALSSPPRQDDDLTVALLASERPQATAHDLLLGVDVSLAEGAHTYWRSPGMAGSPPTLDWSNSPNLETASLLFPAPARIPFMGMDTIGYEKHVLFPIHAKIQDPAQPTHLALSLDLLICKGMCTPKHFDLSLTVPPLSSLSPSRDSDRLEQALRTLPSTQDSATLKIVNVTRTENKVYVEVESNHPLTAPDLFIETADELLFAKPEVSLKSEPGKAMLTAQLESDLSEGQSLTQMPLTVTVTNGSDSIERHVDQDGRAKATQTPTDAAPTTTLPLMILFALLGGVILNLMPCVLPVLSLKIFSMMKHGGNEHTLIRHSFLATASGIVFSFILLACVTLALKAGGAVLGWGVQFQQPTFLVVMIMLLTLFTANLWGFFEITLPRFLMDSLTAEHHPKLAGDFATGMLATLLATPCSAPFLGTAVGFALAAGPVEILAIFTALGIGMALPYFLIALLPHIAHAMPRPGKWMIVLTRLLGFGMAGTTVWLLSVLYDQIGKQLTALIALGLCAILFQLFLRHKNILRLLTLPVILGVFVGAFTIGLAATIPPSVAKDSGVWEKFDEAALSRYVSEGKTVFVDITADWCITCKANKRFTLSRDKVAERLFHSKNVVAMQGDWTTPDPVLTAFLHKHGRYGIPFNAVFGPQAPGGILLSELLTPSAVLEALDHAKGPACPVGWPAGKDC
ncbi:MAG: protein-disulfide reductase DsbD family protein [Bdellovibrionales bacterium]